MISQLKTWWQSLFEPQRSPASNRLFVVAAPSGAGKTSLVKALIDKQPNLSMSVSYTTRAQRATERDGLDYWFVSIDRFEELKNSDDLLEWARVFDNLYGTGRSQIAQLLAENQDVVLEIDWQGARQVREKMPQSVSIFILPPSRTALEQRLRGRSTDSDQVIARRLAESVADMSHWKEFDYVVVNDNFDNAVKELCAIIEGDGEPYQSQRPDLGPLITELLAE